VNWTEIRDHWQEYANKHDTDIWFLNSPLYEKHCSNWYSDPEWPPRRRTNACLILVTRGGDPTVAYRIGRRLQALYPQKLTILVPLECFSAGSLIALAAQKLVVFDGGVLGPMDIQVRKDDEWDEWTSGLTATEALEALTSEVFKSFQSIAVSLRTQSRGQITSRTAMEMAANIIPGLFGHVYRQIDPMRLGEYYRSNKIMKEYGSRLLKVDQDSRSGDSKVKCLNKLVGEYPSHGFVIDREEAQEIFKRVIGEVREPNEDESNLVKNSGVFSRFVLDDTGFVYCLYPEEGSKDESGVSGTESTSNQRNQKTGRDGGQADSGNGDDGSSPS